MAESFVKTMKRDYISIMPKPDGLTAAKNLAEAFEHYNEWHPQCTGISFATGISAAANQ
jgi:putative transposase